MQLPRGRLSKAVMVAALVLATVPIFAADADLQISVAEITGFGTFKTTHSSRRSGFTRRTVAADSVAGVRFTDYTREIPGIQGVNFGFMYRINTSPRGQKLNIRSVIRFPEPGLQNPTGHLYTESIEKRSITVGEHILHGFGFDEAWEILPGEWQFEIWYRDARIIRKTFYVYVDNEDRSAEAGNTDD